MSGAVDLVVRLERGVLGAALRDTTMRRVLLATCGAEDYVDPGHAAVHRSLVSLDATGEYVDWDAVLRHGEGPALSRLVAADLHHAGRARTLAQVEAHAKAMREHGAARRLRVSLAGEIEASERPGSQPTQLFEGVSRLVAEAMRRCTRREASSASAALVELYAHLESTEPDGVATGLAALDERIGALRPGKLYLVAGRPGQGKSALAATIARAACQHPRDGGRGLPRRVMFFSLEMPRLELTTRWIAGLAEVDSRKIERRVLAADEMDRVSAAGSAFADWPLLIDDESSLTIADIAARASVAHALHPLSLVVVDYLQLVRGQRNRASDSREREIAEIARGLKDLAKNLGVPVLALSQLNRAVENRVDKRPQLSDLRESGALEQDADVVMFVYRPGLYDDAIDKTVAEIVVAKQRGGETGALEVSYVPHETRFVDAADHARVPHRSGLRMVKAERSQGADPGNHWLEDDHGSE